MLLLVIAVPLLSQQQTTVKNLNVIINKAQQYTKRNVVMRLKLKNYKIPKYDPWVVKFYDDANHDIVFFIEELKDKKRLKQYTLNLHKGVLYTVKFKVIKVIDTKIFASLISCEPFFIELLLN